MGIVCELIYAFGMHRSNINKVLINMLQLKRKYSVTNNVNLDLFFCVCLFVCEGVRVRVAIQKFRAFARIHHLSFLFNIYVHRFRYI